MLSPSLLRYLSYQRHSSAALTAASDPPDHCLRPDFTSKFVHGLTFGTSKFCTAPHDKINHVPVSLSCNCGVKSGISPDFTSTLVHECAFGTPKIYIAPYGEINHGLVNLSSICDVSSFKFIWIISDLHVNTKIINNNIHTIMVMAFTSCDNTVITYRRKKESRRTRLNLIRLNAVCPLW